MNCDFLARWYSLAEHLAFGRALEHCRSWFLDDVGAARQILALGDGDGRALAKLLSACPQAQIDYVDLSPRMLALAKQRVGPTDRVQWAVGNALKISYPVRHYDLVVAHFFLDCLSDAQANELLKKIVPAMRPGAFWIVSEFRADVPWSRALVRALYFFFRVTTGLRVTQLPEYRTALQQNGLQMIQTQSGLRGLLVSELWRAS